MIEGITHRPGLRAKAAGTGGAPRHRGALFPAAALLFFISIAVAGCASSVKEAARPEKAPYTPPHTLRADAVVELAINGARGISGKAVVYAAAPDMFRIEALGPFGVTAALIMSDGKSVHVFYGGESREFSIDDDRRVLALRPSEFVSILLGAAPEVESGSLKVSGDGSSASFMKFRNGVPAFRAMLSGYPEGYGASLPATVSISDSRASLTIRYVKTEADVELAPTLFSR